MRLCTICARGGSKGVKNKNVRNLAGKPLIAYTIEQAIESRLFKYISVSSDSDEILSVAKAYGADFCIKRPDTLASDSAPKIPAIRHCALQTEELTGEKFDVYVDLDATSPLRFSEDIINSVSLFEEKKVGNVITGTPARRSPYFNLVELDENGVASLSKKLDTQIVRRQDSPKCYDMNGSVYVWNRQTLMNEDRLFHSDTLLYEMPEERSIDIDNSLDFEFVEFLMKKRTYANKVE